MPHEKLPFDSDVAIARIEAAVKPFAKAAMFELAEDGFASPFELLAACIISIRTYGCKHVCTGRRPSAAPARCLPCADISV